MQVVIDLHRTILLTKIIEIMWNTKFFKSEAQMNKWIEQNKKYYKIDVIFVNNGYAVEYKELKNVIFN